MGSVCVLGSQVTRGADVESGTKRRGRSEPNLRLDSSSPSKGKEMQAARTPACAGAGGPAMNRPDRAAARSRIPFRIAR